MNDDNSNQSDETLSGVLRAWRVDTPLPPRFQEGVWRRIGRAEEQTFPVWTAVVQWWESTVRRPAFAAAYLGLLLIVGLSAGYWMGENYTTRIEQEWRTAYVQAVTPR
jgi:hypothetical protein